MSCKSLRQESNPHLGRTKGACLPLTLRRRAGGGPAGWAGPAFGDGGIRTRTFRCKRGAGKGRPTGFEPAPRGSRPRMLPLHHGHHVVGGADDRIRTGAFSADNRVLLPLSYIREGTWRWRGWDSNPRSRAHEAREDNRSSTALGETHSVQRVWSAGFEPAVSGSRNRRSGQALLRPDARGGTPQSPPRQYPRRDSNPQLPG